MLRLKQDFRKDWRSFFQFTILIVLVSSLFIAFSTSHGVEAQTVTPTPCPGSEKLPYSGTGICALDAILLRLLESGDGVDDPSKAITGTANCKRADAYTDARCICPKYMCRLSRTGGISKTNIINEKQPYIGVTNASIQLEKRRVGSTIQTWLTWMWVDGKREMLLAEDKITFDEDLNAGNGTSLLNDGDYSCFGGGYVVGSGSDTREDFYRGAVKTEDFDLHTSFFADGFNNNPTAGSVPFGSYCRVVDGKGNVYTASDLSGKSQAELDRMSYDLYSYWFYPGYYDSILPKDSAYRNFQNPLGICSNPLFITTDLFGNKITGTNSYFGCLPNSFTGAVTVIIRTVARITVFLSFILIGINMIMIYGSPLNKESVAENRKKIIRISIFALGLIASSALLRIIGYDILDIGNFGGDMLRLFSGG